MRIVALAAALMLTVTGLAAGHAAAQGVTMKPDDIIATRQAGMRLTGGTADAMKAAVQSGADVKPFTESAEGLVKWGKIYPSLFPDGTQSGHDTKAKAAIWSDRAGFDKAAAAFVTASEAVETAAKANDKAAFKTAFTDLGKSCGGCHRAYRNR